MKTAYLAICLLSLTARLSALNQDWEDASEDLIEVAENAGEPFLSEYSFLSAYFTHGIFTG